MVKRGRLISVIVMAVAATAIAHADLVPAPWAQAEVARATAVQPRPNPVPTASVSPVLVSSAISDADWLGSNLPVALTPIGLSHSTSDARQGPVIEMPPAPDSAVLCLSALAGLGVWHLGRSARKLNFGVLPEWYHTNGPAQVGHTTPLDLEFSYAALPLCRFESPDTDEPPPPSWLRLVELIEGSYCQYSLPVTAPRGPPSSS